MKKKYIDYFNKIFDFYGHEKSQGFQNSIFYEGYPGDMLLPRLQRAAFNEASGNMQHSRYGIWSDGIYHLINNALDALHAHDNSTAIVLLEQIKNSVMAYKDIQAIFDIDEFSFVNINDLFHAYASHLLSLDDNKSEIVDKNGIIKLLKEYSRVSGADLPRDIDFSIKNGVLRCYIHNPIQNMQADSAAFEGWIIVLKTWLYGVIKYVELDFSISQLPERQYGNPDAGHYNRFLYRLNNMLRLFPDWFFITECKQEIVADFMRWLEASNCLLNHSLQERKSVIETDNLERQIESWFTFEEGKGLLCKQWDIDEERLFNQLPIGVFYEKIASSNNIFTRGASAIDLWGISRDGKVLHLIELKCGNNKKIGVISEILFYIAVIYDTCISKKPLFAFGRYGNAKDTKDILALRNNGQPFGQLTAHILAEKFHPLFNTSVEKLIADGLSSLGIGFDRALYDYSKRTLIP